MKFNQKIGNYYKSELTTSKIIFKNTVSLIPIFFYFTTINKHFINSITLIVLTSLLIDILYNRIANKNIKFKSSIKNSYIIFNSILISFVFPINISLKVLIIVNILSYLIYKILIDITKREVISQFVIVTALLIIFKIDISNSYIYISDIDLKLILVYIATLLYLFIIKYNINIYYYVAIYIYFFITFLLTKDITILVSSLKPIYIILSLFIINDNNKLNHSYYGRNLIGLLLAFITILLIDFNIQYFELISVVVISLLKPYLEIFLLKYNYNKEIKRISPIIIMLSIILLSTI